ncbi:MAG: hypothetical protein EOO07_39235 [Chitinophagaceae bacterium]|nr:MAG: hypothetical protein EOO07_39235 [Chitinophagaceae bacterium]
MKTYIKYLIIMLVFTACTNDDSKNTSNPIDQLPPKTTSGKNTIGCLVNGVPFTDSGLMNNYYQLHTNYKALFLTFFPLIFVMK